MSNPLLFIHGSGETAQSWSLPPAQFAPHQAFAIDLPGHGLRPDTLPQVVSIFDYAQAARQIAHAELHLSQPIIVGHSLGGAIALTMALEYGAELGGLILVGTGARLRVHPAILENARTTTNSNQFYRDMLACDAFDCRARLSEISLPTLIIVGDQDQMTPVKYSTYLRDQISNSRLRVIEQAGHFVMRDQPTAVSQAIQEWLTECF